MAAKPIIESSPVLSADESRTLLERLGTTGLTRERKATLCSYASAAQKAFQKRIAERN
ncbi:hypothetical protein JW322_06750 [Pseudomonas syringae pv. papulans]|uniref:Uncharacterized protein n=1 Tax=Pseudomonas syringae pv. papulans TaxID=83963 RepID=A0AA43DQI5_PSESX|nr:hypothetical protein [Pseudomonas syringae]MDH4621478.1 hypothetical protein [Pseudomonas syringae pv. papulans]